MCYQTWLILHLLLFISNPGYYCHSDEAVVTVVCHIVVSLRAPITENLMSLWPYPVKDNWQLRQERLIQMLTCWSWVQYAVNEGRAGYPVTQQVWREGVPASSLSLCGWQCAHLCVLRELNFLHFLTDGWEQEGNSYIRPFPVCKRSKFAFVIPTSLALSLSADLRLTFPIC